MVKHICECGSDNAHIFSVEETICKVPGKIVPGVLITYICHDCGKSYKEKKFLFKRRI